MSIKVTIEAFDKLTEMKGTSQKTNKAYHIRRQTAYMFNGKSHPTPIEINLGEDGEAYPAGEYTFAPECYKLGARGPELDSFNLKLVALNPVRASGTPNLNISSTPKVA